MYAHITYHKCRTSIGLQSVSKGCKELCALDICGLKQVYSNSSLLFVWLCLCLFQCACMCSCVCLHVHVRRLKGMHGALRTIQCGNKMCVVCVHVRVCVCMYIYVYIHGSKHSYVCLPVFVCMSACMSVYVCVYVHCSSVSIHTKACPLDACGSKCMCLCSR